MSCVSSSDKENTGLRRVVYNIDGGTVVPEDANKIYINFYTASKYPEISKKLVVKIKELISMDGRLAVVADEKGADLELKGFVTEYQIQNIFFSNVGVAEKKRLRITASINLINKKKNQMILYENNIQAFRQFSEVTPPVENEDSVKRIVIKQLAQRISSKTITGWYSKYLQPIEKKK